MTNISTSESITLSGDGLTVDDVLAVARGRTGVELDPEALRRVRAARDVVERVLARGPSVYELNTVTSLAMGFDYLRLGISHAAQVANERAQKLLWSHFSGLPTGLATQDGPTGGLRPLGRSFAALSAEGRFLANPVSLDFRG